LFYSKQQSKEAREVHSCHGGTLSMSAYNNVNETFQHVFKILGANCL